VDPETVLERIRSSTEAAGMEPTTELLSGRSALVARTSAFRWRWMATKLHTFLVASVVPPGTDLDVFLRAATDHAIANKGGLPRGLQTGSAIVAVAITSGATESDLAWGSTPHGRQFAAISFPVLVDAANGTVVHPQRMVIGAIYTGYLKGIVAEHVTPAVAPASGP
jgi:hypothetical protein